MRGRECIRLVCDETQKRRNEALGGDYTSVTNVVELTMLEQTVPRDALPAWLQEYPVSGDPAHIAVDAPSDLTPVAAEAPVGEAHAGAQDDVDAEAAEAQVEAEAQ